MAKDLVFIKLPRPNSAAHADKLAAMANRMMARLGDTAGWSWAWSEQDQHWTWRCAMGNLILPDDGNWFDLDYLGR